MGASISGSNTSFSRCLPLPIFILNPLIQSRGLLMILLLEKKTLR